MLGRTCDRDGVTGRAGGEATAVLRRAVRDSLRDRPDGPVLVAVSGGADSLALAAATVAVRPGSVRAVVVDHGLQDGSAHRARETVAVLATLGVGADVHTVTVGDRGGPEAAARRARYGALRAARAAVDTPVLLGHTLDDQAETVLLGLGRGSGARSMAGMRRWDDPWLRPLLGVRRTVTRAACAELGLPVWDDPHNADPRFTRVRLRHEVLPLLEEVLAGGVAEALARTAAQLREDGDALDAAAGSALAAALGPGPEAAGHPAPESADPTTPLGPAVAALVDLPPAVRRRAVRAWLAGLGVTGLTDVHLRAAEALAAQGPDRVGVALPGGLELVRERGKLGLRPVRWPGR